jgi:acetyl-CoA/propionyl-CoA carboxylase biotin carboxyl carrier protein
MVGKILNILVSDSDEVKKGQELLVIEAMKMENKITAPCDGIVEKLKVSIGQQIAIQDDILTIKKKLI